jgi:cell division protein FtsB
LQGESTALRELIEQTQLTTEHLENLKMQERQSLAQLETINRKLETVTELLQEEKGKLSAEVKKLSSEIDRLSYVKV